MGLVKKVCKENCAGCLALRVYTTTAECDDGFTPASNDCPQNSENKKDMSYETSSTTGQTVLIVRG